MKLYEKNRVFSNRNSPSIWAKKSSYDNCLEENILAGGAEALDRLKGQPPVSDKAKNGTNKHSVEKEMTYEQQLERENELLRLEGEYLKKLRAFQMNPDGYLEKHKQHYHSNSKKRSD